MASSPIVPDADLTIGRFARLTRLSARTLRKYDALGILSPASVDPDTAYRYYSPSQVPRAETVRLLRSLDVPLGEIAGILDSDDPEAARHLLEHQLARVKERIARDHHTVMRLESAVARGGAIGAYRCALRGVDQQSAVALRVAASKSDIDAAVARALHTLHAFLAGKGLTAAGREIVVYDFDPLEQDDYRADVCLPLAAPTDGSDPIRACTLPACIAAWTVHHGPDEDLQSAYCGLLGWIIENGLTIVGHERETYLVDERDTDDPREFVTEIMWPVEPRTGGA
jgi:DNA-binding transcriptional MerR regulator